MSNFIWDTSTAVHKANKHYTNNSSKLNNIQSFCYRKLWAHNQEQDKTNDTMYGVSNQTTTHKTVAANKSTCLKTVTNKATQASKQVNKLFCTLI